MIKSRTINKYLKGCLIASAATVTVMSTSIFQTLAAGNYKDTVHEEYNSTDLVEVTDIGTEQRGKWDYTSSYAYNKNSNTDFDAVFVYGSYNEDNDPSCGEPAYDGLHNCTYGETLDLPMGCSRYFPNTVKEEGYECASLRIWPDYGGKGMYIYFLWSPDSI
ncbi:hypothetical protein LI288_02200 [Lachnospira pectinoschiza]|jgi:hypothetical protein|uniref:DUF2712 domain-containing protein n=1 Tax=Lachnospira pectinoschiza TaxID=28052 RepID=UPI001D06078D|nr:DUF2712 domain-containing protein [Lachnospira pectinoschiza]MCB6141860.1 hypothetical protein [Lachnospira pectinoschiza]